MIVTILIVIAVAVAAVLAYAATKPDTFLVRRSASIAAPPEKIFPTICARSRLGRRSRKTRT